MSSNESFKTPSFALLVDQLAASALVQLGLVPNPLTGRTEASKERARFTLLQLELLAAKTRGNLTEQEELHLETRIEDIAARLDRL